MVIAAFSLLLFSNQNGSHPIPTMMSQSAEDTRECSNDSPQMETKNEAATPLPILMYHKINTSPKSLNDYTITPETFQGDMEYLRSHGYTTISIKQLIAYTRGEYTLPEKPIMITFDDGYANFATYALPILKEYNMCAVMAIVGKYTDMFTEHEDHNVKYSNFSWSELVELSKSPNVELAAHSYDMHSLKGRKGCKIMKGESVSSYEMVFSRDLDLLERRFITYIGEKPVAFAYPFGFYCEEAKEILRSRGYAVLFTCIERVNKLTGDPEELLSLCRFNRPSNMNREQFFKKIES